MESTVVYNYRGESIATWTATERLTCPSCAHVWRAVTPASVKEVTCPLYHRSISLDGPGSASDPDSPVALEMLHQWTSRDLDERPWLGPIATSLPLTFDLRAPLYFWEELKAYPASLALLPADFPLTERDFAVPPGPLALERLNAAHETHDTPATLGLMPMGAYRRGVLTVTYSVLDRMATDNRRNPLYEWQRFLALAKDHVTLLALCPDLAGLPKTDGL